MQFLFAVASLNSVVRFQIADLLLLGSAELLVASLSGYTFARLADGIRSVGRVFFGHQKSGDLYILRRLFNPHVQSLHGFRGECIKIYVQPNRWLYIIINYAIYCDDIFRLDSFEAGRL